jgi:hypothetical protein
MDRGAVLEQKPLSTICMKSGGGHQKKRKRREKRKESNFQQY